MAAAGVIALLALAVVVASLTYLHLEPTGLSPVRNAVSQYGITSFRAGYRVASTSRRSPGSRYSPPPARPALAERRP